MMTSLVGFLCLVSALTATSSDLSCTECVSISSSTCSGDSITCPGEFMCGSVYTRDLGEGVRSEMLQRGCLPSSQCNLSGTMSIMNGQFGIGSSCCSSDDCTPTLPTFPTKSHNPNGVICPSCTADQPTWCYTSDTVQCTADENMCLLQEIEQTGSGSKASSALRGCATKSFCDHDSLFYYGEESIMRVTFTCTSGGISAHKVVLTPAILCLLLLKLFL
ncbi:phospholipase A2 inhibitor and Ly6/PLAUR domain-containing protein-like [Eleutherodactylus coqui]|uniref:phospholipase A2 inhibitor and Ly6/PLAUR domain-containing protein-like n=1 Tax=Eleutherodactylus coqui TaxID=57060 RepID=UPI003461AB5C